MKQSYEDLRQYHSHGEGILTKEVEWPSIRAAILSEKSNDVHFTKTNRSALVLTLDGSSSHFTKMADIEDNSATHPGDICFIPAGIDIHLAWTNHASHQKTILLDFDTSIFSTYAPEVLSSGFCEGHLLPSNFKPCADLEYLVRILGQEVESKGARGQLFAQSAIRLVALQVATSAWTTPMATPKNRPMSDARTCRAIEFIEAHYCRDVTLLEIAAAAGLSATQLTQAFQQATGETPYAYVISRRLRQAVHLLRHSNTPIAHIAIDVGFADQAHMTRTFQRKLGATPKGIRNQR